MVSKNSRIFKLDVMENLPDNSHVQTNLVVKGLDISLVAHDLHLIFSKFGEIKSCKIALDPDSGASKGYGFVWYHGESSCKSALECKNLPYQVELFQPMCVRQIE